MTAVLAAPERIASGTRVRLWLPFYFDAEERWNEGIRSATVRLRLRAGAVEESWVLPAEHVLRDFHEDRRRERDLDGAADGADAPDGAGAADGADAADRANASDPASGANAAGAPGPVPPEAPSP